MSFLSDLFEGNFSNLGHDLTAHIGQDLPLMLGAAALPFALPGALGALGLGGTAAGEGLFGGLGSIFGGAEGGAAALDPLLGAGAAGSSAGEMAMGAGAGEMAMGAGGAIPAETAGGAMGFTGQVGSNIATSPGISAINSAMAGGGAGGADPLGAGLPGIAGAPGGETAASSGGFWDSLTSGAMKQLTTNPLGVAAAGTGLGMSMLGGKQSPMQGEMKSLAERMGQQGAWLQSYLQTGTLPPAMKASLDQATSAAKARVISNYARNGQSTDPSQNTALAQELNSVETNAVAAMAQAQIQMLNTGMNETGLSAQLYGALTQMDRADNANLMQSIANFASALGGGSNYFRQQTRQFA